MCSLIVRSTFLLHMQSATSPPRSATSVYPVCSHTPHLLHVHLYHIRPLVLYLYHIVYVLLLIPHVLKTCPSVLKNQSLLVLESFSSDPCANVDSNIAHSRSRNVSAFILELPSYSSCISLTLLLSTFSPWDNIPYSH